MFDQKTPGLSLSEGVGLVWKSALKEFQVLDQKFLRGVRFLFDQKNPGDFCLKAEVGVRSALKEFQVWGLKGLSGG